MSRVCQICGKGPRAGRTIKRRGMAKKKGGAGQKITGISRRIFIPNLQSVKINLGGVSKKIRVCAKCLKAEKVKKSVK